MDQMDIRFYGTWHGRKLYRVLRDGTPLFTGSMGECRRYTRLHQEKREKDMRELSAPRRRKVIVKRYRVAARRLAAW
jgi:hypothetical protein